MVRRVGRVLAALTLVLSAAACDDNPLAEDRDEAAYFRLNPSNVAVNAGSTVTVDAVVVNKYGAATNAGVTATPCDNKISAVTDTSRTEFEFPERFVVTGVALGRSCLVVRGGGITDTVDFRVVPAAIVASKTDTVGSGESKAITYGFRDVNGNTITGFNAADLSFQSLTGTIVTVDSAGNVSGAAPGTGRVLVSLKSGVWGAARSDTAVFHVRAGNFTGTVSASPTQAGVITFTAGAVPFDTDTNVTFNGLSTYVLSRTATTLRAVVPGVTGSTPFAITNMGPQQIATVGTVTVGADARETVNNTFTASTPTVVLGDTVYAVVDGTDTDDIFRLELPATTAVNLNAAWLGTSDIDVYLHNGAGTEYGAYNCATATANPESCAYNLPAGVTFLRINNYTPGTPAAAIVRFIVRAN